MICPYEATQFRAWETPQILADSFDRVGDSSPLQFERIKVAVRPPCQCEAQKPHPLRGGRQHAVGFEGGLGGGNEDDSLQPALLMRRLGYQQMPQMNWIERTSEQAKFHSG